MQSPEAESTVRLQRLLSEYQHVFTNGYQYNMSPVNVQITATIDTGNVSCIQQVPRINNGCIGRTPGFRNRA